LVDQIETLTERVRALEQGLDEAWREEHDNEHPLLTERFRQIKTNRILSVNGEENVAIGSSERLVGRVQEEAAKDVVEVLEIPPNLSSTVKGTLNVVGANYNATQYYGATARTEVCP
jgi:hypothetical protein